MMPMIKNLRKFEDEDKIFGESYGSEESHVSASDVSSANIQNQEYL